MNPKTVKRLQEDVPEFRELVAFLQMHAAKLDRLSALKNASIDDYYYLVVGRLHAKEIIDDILGELLATVEKPAGTDPKEYVV